MKMLPLQTARILSVFLVAIFSGCAATPAPPQAGEQPIVVTKLTQSANSWDGKLLPAYPSRQPQITILRIRIAPGAKLPLHHHPVINAGVLLSGQLSIETSNGDKLHLKAGDPIVETVNTVHYGVNDGKVPAEIIVVYAGAVDQAITVVEPQ